MKLVIQAVRSLFRKIENAIDMLGIKYEKLLVLVKGTQAGLDEAIASIENVQWQCSNLNADKMNKSDPTGTGAFSMNRNPDSSRSSTGTNSGVIGTDLIANEKATFAIGEYNKPYTMGHYAELVYQQKYRSIDTSNRSIALFHSKPVFSPISGSFGIEPTYELVTADQIKVGDMVYDGITSLGYTSASHYYVITKVYGDNLHFDYLEHRNGARHATRCVHAFIVGNGTSNDDRSNAHTLDWDGNAWFAGKVYIGGTGMDDPDAVELGALTDAAKAEIVQAVIAELPVYNGEVAEV